MKKTLIASGLMIFFMGLSGFNLDNAIVPHAEILSGGPAKDGIPAILKPNFVKSGQADFLESSDHVIGIRIGKVARAYPIKILNWHEVVNDSLNGIPIVVTFWPLTQSAVVYSRQIKGQDYTFGVSGRLYKSNVLLYDHQTDSLWSQLMQKAISGPLAGMELQKIPSTRTRWQTWQNRNPKTQVLSADTGYNRNYAIDPYEDYYRIGSIMFPVGDVRRDLAVKDRVLGIQINKKAKAYPLTWLSAHAGIHKDQLADQTIEIEVNPDGEVVSVRNQNGEAISSIYTYWFAWQAFHPETLVFQEPR